MSDKFTYYGIKFEVERSKDFDDDGRMIDGNGYHLNLFVLPGETTGLGWFEHRHSALAYASEFAANLKDQQ